MSGRPQANFRQRGGAVRGPGRTGPFPSPFYVPRSPNPNFQSPSSFPRQRFVTREMVEAAVAKAQRDLVSSGENISVWKVSQSAALALKVSSWDSLGFRFNDIPYLRELQFVEGKVNAFIHCFVSVRRMTSVHELGLEICKGEGVEEFGDLGLGPLLAHPLVRHYFLVPSDLKEVCSITIDDLVQSLSTFLYRFKSKEFTVEEFLDYLMRKYSVASRDNLGVRIQSMGLYIKFIKGARRAESAALKSIQERQTYPAPEHLSNLPFLFKDYLGEITQEVGSSDAGNIGAAFIKCCQCCPAQKKKGKKHGGCKCNGSPFVDELKLIGIKLSMFNCESSGKLSTGIEEKLESYGAAAYEITKINASKANQLILSAKQVDSFIATWKGACQKHSADEVLSMMLNVYRCSDKQKRKMQMLFFEYPAVALLNMAVRFLGGESLDVLDRAFDMDSSVYQTSSLYANQPKSESSSDMDAISEDENSIGNAEKNVTLEDIYKQIGCYFKIELNPRRKDLSMEKQLVLRDCERWLTGQFLVEKFEVLGHGNFLDFLEKHLSVLPSQVNDLLNGIIGRQPSIPIFMSQQQSLVVFSQAARNFGKNNELTDKHISMILRKQFPVIALSLENGESIEGLGLADSQSLSNVSSSVAFSVSLLGDCCGKNSLLFDNKIQSDLPEMNYGRGELTSLLGSVSTEDALKCLLRAPMLSDLMLWSHWDLIFGPSLGPLLDWLIDFGCIKELSCIVTSEARIIRVDHSATINGFFEVLAQGSAFNTAVMFLSLFHVFGGSKSIPVSLLRRYAQCGIDSIIKNCMNNLHGNADETLSVHKGSVLGKNRCLFFNDTRTVRCSPSTPPGNDKRIIIYKELSAVNSAYTIVSLFILDCLGYLPSEFRSFAAEILVSAFHFFTRDAAAVILNECRGSDECIMLHGIGLTLGIVEWIEDFKKYSSATSVDTYEPLITRSRILKQCSIEDKNFQGISRNDLLKNDDIEELQVIPAAVTDSRIYSVLGVDKSDTKLSSDKSHTIYGYAISGDHDTQDATIFIETIRREEFGLDSNLGTSEKSLLKKQHARLGRALHCLSHELYSQDSHFILELVQNADDNNYHQDVEPTLIFILNASGIVVMNNELGFSDRNIRALCDIGNSTKKGSSGGYIGHKGIGFKSVFRLTPAAVTAFLILELCDLISFGRRYVGILKITDAPEIHSNGFHVKFDITEGQIGFVLPTNIPPCDANFYKKNVLDDSDQVDSTCWKTCIVLPFKSNFKQGKGIGSIISMFADLHPSLLLFLQRLKCIVFKNMLYDKLITMRRETLEDGMVMVSQGEEKMKWLVVHMSLHAFLVRPDVQTTKIAMAFTIEQTDNGECSFLLDQQPVFAFLPLKNYGLKFIVQGDFILPSSREEVNEDSAWNQWLLSEMPDLFLSAEKSFCALSCFKDNPANAVNCFMSFVPLIGEVHGFFSPLPQMILSKLRSTNCLLLEASALEWVPPCRVLRNWDDNLRMFLSGDLLQQHLGLSYLNKDIILSDPLARALGIQDYGPKILIRILSSICEGKCIKELGLQWLASWLIAFFATLPVSSSGYLTSAHAHLESDLFNNLRKIPFIPLSDGSYCSMEKGQIWFPFNKFDTGSEGENILMNLPGLYAELRTVISCLFTIESMFVNLESSADTIIKVLHKIGVQKLSSHNVVKNHILQSIYDEKTVNKEPDLRIEYLIFIMHHFQSSCFECKAEREGMLQKLQKTKILFTNNGYICPVAEPIYFSLEFGNVFNIKKLLDGTNIKLNEIDTIYLKHPCTQLLHLGLIKWREFFKSLCVTDFVQVNQVKKNFSDLKNVRCHDDASPGELFVNDWESPELVSLLSFLSSNKCLEKSKYLLEVLDKMWDDHFSTKARCYNNSLVDDQRYSFPSSFMKCITEFQWVSCSLDEEIHYPRDLFYDCEQVRSLFGMVAPYAAPQVTSKRFVEDLGFKVTVTLNDAFQVLQIWRNSEAPLASISQMSNFYTFIRDELAKLEGSIIPEFRKDIAMFIPSVYNPNFMSIESGVFMLPHQLYWHDTTGCLVHIREAHNTHFFASETKCIQCITLDIVYPELHDFLVADCGVLENPSFFHYLEILLHLSSIALPSDVALLVFKVFLKWSDDFNSGLARNEDMLRLKNCLLKSEITVLPTEDKWVSLHPRFGLVCWSDNEKLIDEYVQLNSVKFLYFGELTEIEKEMLSVKVAPFLKAIGIPMLAEVISREAIFYGIADSTKEASLINWILPYVQRYLYKLHFNIYCDLKKSGLHQITQLEVLVVEKLFYRNTLQGNSGTNQTRHECKSLLQLNRLYITRHADTHSMFLELSRLFFNGAPNIQMANFLHIITKELDSTEEQIESFIVNNFNVPKLAEGEPIWSLVKSPKLNYDEMSSVLHAFPRGKQQRLKPSRKPLSKLNWPPAHTEPASNLHYTNFDPRITKIREVKPGTIFSAEEDKPNPSVADKNTLISLDGAETSLYASTDILLAAKDDTSSSDDQPTSVVELHNETYLSEFSNRDRLFLEAPEDGQSYSTGRLGELVAYKYFCEKLGQASVKWVNEKYEMGYPYDLIIEEELSARFVEVKATTSATKDWFSISANEWHCAEEKGESYSIAWVILPSPEVAQVHVLNNPLKLCQQKLVQLVLLLPNIDLCFKV